MNNEVRKGGAGELGNGGASKLARQIEENKLNFR